VAKLDFVESAPNLSCSLQVTAWVKSDRRACVLARAGRHPAGSPDRRRWARTRSTLPAALIIFLFFLSFLLFLLMMTGEALPRPWPVVSNCLLYDGHSSPIDPLTGHTTCVKSSCTNTIVLEWKCHTWKNIHCTVVNQMLVVHSNNKLSNSIISTKAL